MPAYRAIGERGRSMIRGAIVLGSLLVVLLSSVGAQAAATSSLASPPQTWSHSLQRWDNNTTTRTLGNVTITYNVSTFYGVNDRITATNTSNTSTEMHGLRWTNATLVASWCIPNCTAPLYRELVKVRAGTRDSQFLNLTTTAKVDENGTLVNALGVTNASARNVQNLTETTNLTWGNRTYTSVFDESQLAGFNVQFSPALGLIPWNLSTNLTWNATSSYNATGGWNDSYSFDAVYNGTTYGRTGSFVGQLNRTGHESVRGKDLGSGTVNNRSVVRIGLRSHGPFNLDNDLFLTAVGSDLFQGATSNWTVNPAPEYDLAGSALSSVYAERAAPAASSTGTGTSPSSGGGSSASGGGSASTTSSPSAPGSTTPVSAPVRSTPSPAPISSAPSTIGQRGHAPGWTVMAMLPWSGVVGVLVVAGALGVASYRRRNSR
ncbi:MAG: hypothetical protein L3J95_00455 [Thermoplasmata archaeon]|nr:hypothetical protein [Thermoplasmata archaeon]MCI4358891.1 hypothetical protein [Thermoplasmata archaeon]